MAHRQSRLQARQQNLPHEAERRRQQQRCHPPPMHSRGASPQSRFPAQTSKTEKQRAASLPHQRKSEAQSVSAQSVSVQSVSVQYEIFWSPSAEPQPPPHPPPQPPTHPRPKTRPFRRRHPPPRVIDPLPPSHC